MNRRPHAPSKAKQARALPPAAPFRMPPKNPECGKRRCSTKDQALAYVLRLARVSADPLRIYLCPACAGWHVTKKPEWKDPTA